ncbi:perlucin-like protein [Dendroctonus ponderosae]|uniref:C-type lectin domain-containing protein n=1 Tax=Dendroctonus ponderosae TaxID=77166 RepID=U4UBP9_DENPD|nr:perlucin-like protein [Dendroctonus ponderosae]ERL89763.1 hypothetical protein D910_07124 [Dendroctonus ponderosae]KAH1025226.1 hypothetical protein HUJ05_009991 [Dendroctonus ponderosae]
MMFKLNVLVLVLLIKVINAAVGKYVVSFENTNWYQALINCKTSGMELASIHSEEEQTALEEYLKKNDHNKGYWLGGTKEGNGEYYWATTGIKMVYSKWLFMQPDNAKFDHNFNQGEHCVAWGMPTYSPTPAGWNDLTCSVSLPYICQRIEYCS